MVSQLEVVFWSWVEMMFLTSLSDVFYLIRLEFHPGVFEVDGQPSVALCLIPLRLRASVMMPEAWWPNKPTDR